MDSEDVNWIQLAWDRFNSGFYDDGNETSGSIREGISRRIE